MRLIDADAMEKQAYDDVHYHAELEDWEFDLLTHYLDHAPTIDAVIIPDCNQCIYNEDISHWDFCEHCIGSTHRNNSFVPKDGELKDGE